jgi:enamine deaminase RidA (YjgF/YER057c/UK114 family)
MKLLLFLLLSVCTISESLAQDNKIDKKKFHFGAEQDTAGGYAQAIKVDNIIYVSGTVALDITPEGIKRVYKVIEKSLEPYGATLQNVVKETIFTTDIEAMKKHNAIRKEIYKGDYPSSTWVQISRLFMHEARLEIEVIAHLKK